MQADHNGHRERIRQRALSDGAESLHAHELVEYLLYFTVPRHNTNPMSHRLLDRFGSLQRLFDAEPEELMQVAGINATDAEWLHLVGRVVRCYAALEEGPVQLTNRRQTREFLRAFYARPGMGDCWLLCLSSSGLLTHVLPLDAPGGWHSSENLRRIVDQSLHCRACGIILAQQRDEAHMSDAERRQTEALMRSLSCIQVSLLEHVVMNRSGTDCCYATLSEARRQQLAVQAPVLAHWLDEP